MVFEDRWIGHSRVACISCQMLLLVVWTLPGRSGGCCWPFSWLRKLSAAETALSLLAPLTSSRLRSALDYDTVAIAMSASCLHAFDSSNIDVAVK